MAAEAVRQLAAGALRIRRERVDAWRRAASLRVRLTLGMSGGGGRPRFIRIRAGDLADAGVERVFERAVGAEGGKPVLADGSVLDVENVVWCTGFGRDDAWLRFPVPLDDDGYPQQERGVAASVPGLYFVGMLFLHSFSSMLVLGAGRDGERVAKHIAARCAAADGRRAREARRLGRRSRRDRRGPRGPDDRLERRGGLGRGRGGPGRSGGSGLDGLSAVRGDREWPDLRKPRSRKPDAELEQPDRADDERRTGELWAGEPLTERERGEAEPGRHLDRDEQRRRSRPDEPDRGEEGGQREDGADEGADDDADEADAAADRRELTVTEPKTRNAAAAPPSSSAANAIGVDAAKQPVGDEDEHGVRSRPTRARARSRARPGVGAAAHEGDAEEHRRRAPRHVGHRAAHDRGAAAAPTTTGRCA